MNANTTLESVMDMEYIDDVDRQLDTEELYQLMLEKEKRGEMIRFNDNYLTYRQVLVEWMTQIGESIFGLLPLTIHLAVAYMDKAVSRQEVHPSRLQLVAVACMLAAAKHEEMETKVPSVQELNHCCKNMFTAPLICKMEVMILNLLNWELMVLTPRHFLETFLARGAAGIYPDDLLNEAMVPFDKHQLLQQYLRKYAEFFTDFCLHEHSFCNYTPSIVASSSLAAARKKLKITPLWPNRLNEMTGYSKTDFNNCLEHMWNVFQNNFAEE